MKNKTKKILLPLAAMSLTSLIVVSATNDRSNDNVKNKNNSGFYHFHNAYDYFNQGSIKNEAYGYGIYDNFGNLSAKYNLDALYDKPYNDTRTWIGATKSINGSDFSTHYNGDANLMEKGFSAMGIKLASKPENRYELNASSFIISPNNPKFNVLAKNLLNQLASLKDTFEANATLLKEYKESQDKEKAFVYDLYLSSKDVIKSVVLKKKLSGKSIDFSKFQTTQYLSRIPTFKYYNLETNTIAYIQSLIFTLKNFNYGGIINASGLRNLDFIASLGAIFNTYADIFLMKYHNVASKLEDVVNQQILVINDDFITPNFNSAGDSLLSQFNQVVSSSVRSAIEYKDANSPLSIIVKSSNPLVVDYNPSYKQVIYNYLNSLGANNKFDPNTTFDNDDANNVANILYEYINKQAKISNVDTLTLFNFNQDTFGSTITSSIQNGKINLNQLKNNLKHTKLTVPSTIINSKDELINQLIASKSTLSNNYDLKLKNLNDWELHSLKYDYYASINNKLSTENAIFNYISDLDININNKDEFERYEYLNNRVDNLSEQEQTELNNLKVKFSKQLKQVSLKQYLKNVALLNNLNSAENLNLIDSLQSEESFLNIYLTIQKLYGLKDSAIYNALPSDLFTFIQSLENKKDEFEEKLKELYNQTRINFEKTNKVDENSDILISALKKQIANYDNLLSATDIFNKLLDSLNTSEVNIANKIKEYNVNSENIQNNLSTMLLSAINGFDTVSSYYNNRLLQTIIKKDFDELTAADNGKLARLYTWSILKNTGKTFLNLLSFNFGAIYEDSKEAAQKDNAADEVIRSKGFTLTSFLKLQSDIELNKMIQRSSYLAMMANKVLYMLNLLETNQMDKLRQNADFKEIFNTFILANKDSVELNETNAPDYLISQSVNNLVIAMRNLLEKDNENNMLIQANSNESSNIKFLGQYVSQALALMTNYNKALGVNIDSNNLVYQAINNFNEQYSDESEIQNADDLEKDLINFSKVNIFNYAAINTEHNTIENIFNTFKERIKTYFDTFKDTSIKNDYETSELWSKLQTYDENYFKQFENNSEAYTDLVKNTFLNVENEQVLEQILKIISVYSQNASLINDLNQNKAILNSLDGDTSIIRGDNVYKEINTYFEDSKDVSQNYIDALSKYFKDNQNSINKEASDNLNASDKYLDAFKLNINSQLNNYYGVDSDYNNLIIEHLDLAYHPNNIANFGFDDDGFNDYDETIETYSQLNDIKLIQSVNEAINKDETNLSTWKDVINSKYITVSKWWANNVPSNLFSKTYFTYKLVGVPIYSQFRHGHFLATFKNQLLVKEVNKVSKYARKLGNSVSKTEIRALLEAGDSVGIEKLLATSNKSKSLNPFKNIYNKFRSNRIINNSEKIAKKGINRYSVFSTWTDKAALPSLKKFNTDQAFSILTYNAKTGRYNEQLGDLFNLVKQESGQGASRSKIMFKMKGDPEFAKLFANKLDDGLYKSRTFIKTAKKLEKIQNAKNLSNLAKEAKTLKVLKKFTNSKAALVALNGKKAYRLYKLAKVGNFFKGVGRLFFGAFKTNPIGIIVSVAIDSVINFLTFDTEKKAGYWLPLNSRELDNIHNENDYNNVSSEIAKRFNDDKFLNPVKIANNNYTNISYLKALVADESFALSEAKRLLKASDIDANNFNITGTKEYTFLYYLKENAKNQLLNLDTQSISNNNISSHKFRNTTLYFDNLDQQYNSVKFDFQDKSHNYANYLNRTNLIDLNVDFKTFMNNPFTEYLDLSAFNAINGEFFVSDNQGVFGAYNGYVKLPINDLLNTGLTSLVMVGNNASSSFTTFNDNLKNYLEIAPIYKPLTKSINASVLHSDNLTNAERAANKNARWYSLIPLVGQAVAESQRDGSAAFELDNAPTIKALPYLPSNVVYQILDNANGNGQFRQALYAYSTITVKLVRLNNGNLGLSVIQGIYDNSTGSYSFNKEPINIRAINGFNGALLYNAKELNKDFFKSVVNEIEKVNVSNKYNHIYLDVNDDIIQGSNLSNVNLVEIANKQLIISHNNPEVSDNFFVKSYVKRLKDDLLKNLKYASMPQSIISESVINEQVNEEQKKLIENIEISQIDFLPYYDNNSQLQLKIRYDVKFLNARFNKKANPAVSFFINNSIYNFNQNQNFFNSKQDILNLKAVKVKENIQSKMKAILSQVLKIKEYSSLNQASYDLNSLYEKSINVDKQELKELEKQYLELLKNNYEKRINDIKFNYLRDAFLKDWISQENLDKEYSQSTNKKAVLAKYYDDLLLEDKVLLENRINKEVFNITPYEDEYKQTYTDNISLHSDELKLQFLANALNLVYYQKKTYQNYDVLEQELSKNHLEFNIALTNPFSFRVFTNKQINLNNGGEIVFRDNFNNQSYKQVNVKNNEVVFAYDLNSFDNQERIYYNEYTNNYVENPYQLLFNLKDDNNRNVNITINFKLPNLKQSDIAFNQYIDNNIKSVYTADYINLKALPFAKNLNNLTLDDVNSLIKNNLINLTFSNDKDQLALAWIKQDSSLSEEQRENQITLFNNQKNLNDNDRFIGFIAQNPFKVFRSNLEKEHNLVHNSFTLNGNEKINELFYDGNNIEYINTSNPFTSIDVSYLFDNNKLLNINNLVSGTKITWFKTLDGNKASSKVEVITENNNQAIINFGKNSEDYSGLYKLSFLVPTQNVNNQITYFKFNKLIYLSKHRANEIKENTIKNEINNYFKTNHSTHYLLDLHDNSYYQSISPFINKLNKSNNKINAVVFNQLYQDYIYSKNKYLINTLKYKNITNKVRSLLDELNVVLSDIEIKKVHSLDEYVVMLASKLEKNKQNINNLKDELQLNKNQLSNLQNDQKNKLIILEKLNEQKYNILTQLNKLGANANNWNNINYDDINSIINISKQSFRKLQIKELLYHKQLEKKLVLNENTITQLLNYIHNDNVELPTIPEKTADNYNIDEILNSVNEFNDNLEYKDLEKDKELLKTNLEHIKEVLGLVNNQLNSKLTEFINQELSKEKAKKDLPNHNQYTETSLDNYKTDFNDASKISDLRLITYDFDTKNYVIENLNQVKLVEKQDSLHTLLAYAKTDNSNTTYHLVEINKVDNNHIKEYVKVYKNESDLKVEWLSAKNTDGKLFIANLVNQNLKEVLKEIVFDELYAQNETLISFINNSLIVNRDKIAELKTFIESKITNLNSNFNSDNDGLLKPYFAKLQNQNSFNEANNKKKLTLLSAYNVLVSQLNTNFETLLKQELNKVNNQIESNLEVEYEQNIVQIQKRIDVLEKQIKEQSSQSDLEIKKWIEQIMFSYNDLNLIKYLELTTNLTFNNNLEYLDFWEKYLNDNQIENPVYQTILNTLRKVENYIQSLYDIDEDILVKATSDESAFEYFVNKLTPIISDQEGVHIEKLNQLLKIHNLESDFVFNQRDWKIKGFVNQVNIEDNNNYVVLQLYAKNANLNQKQVIMLKLNYDKDVEFYVLSTNDEISKVIDTSKGEWKETLKWNDAKKSVYAALNNNPDYILRDLKLNARFVIKDKNKVLEHKIIKNNVLNNLDLFNNVLSLREFNSLFSSQVINDLESFNNIWDLKFKLSFKEILNDNLAQITQYTLQNSQYKVVVNVVLNKGKENSYQDKQTLTIYSINNKLEEQSLKINNINSLSYDLNKDFKLIKDINNLVNIDKDNDGLKLISDIITKKTNSVILNASQIKVFLENNNLTFSSDIENDNFFKNVDLINASGEYKPYIYQVSLTNNNADLDIVESGSLGFVLLNLKISIFDEYKKQYNSNPFIIILQKQENNYDKTITNNVNSINSNEKVVKNNITSTIKDIISEVNREYLYYQSKYLQNDYFNDVKKLNLKSAIFYALNTYAYINPVFNEINNDKQDLEHKVNYIYQYIINHYAIPQGANETETFNKIIQMMLDNYLFNDKQLEDDVDQNGKVIKAKPQLYKNQVYNLNHYQFSKVINYRDISFNLSFIDKDDEIKRLLLNDKTVLYDENNQAINNPFNQYYLEYNNSTKYITFRVEFVNDKVEVRMITTTNETNFNLGDLLLDSEKELDRDITNNLIISRLEKVEALIQNLIEIQKTQLELSKNNQDQNIIRKRPNIFNDFEINLLSQYNKDLSKSILNKDNMFIAKKQVFNLTDENDINKLVNDKDYILSLTKYHSDSYLNLLNSDEYHLRLLEVIKQNDIVSYIYEIAFENNKLENIKLQLNFNHNNLHDININNGTFNNKELIKQLDHKEIYFTSNDNNIIKLSKQNLKLINKNSHLSLIKDFYKIDNNASNSIDAINVKNAQSKWLPYLLASTGLITLGLSVLVYVIVKRKKTKTNFKA